MQCPGYATWKGPCIRVCQGLLSNLAMLSASPLWIGKPQAGLDCCRYRLVDAGQLVGRGCPSNFDPDLSCDPLVQADSLPVLQLHVL